MAVGVGSRELDHCAALFHSFSWLVPGFTGYNRDWTRNANDGTFVGLD